MKGFNSAKSIFDEIGLSRRELVYIVDSGEVDIFNEYGVPLNQEKEKVNRKLQNDKYININEGGYEDAKNHVETEQEEQDGFKIDIICDYIFKKYYFDYDNFKKAYHKITKTSKDNILETKSIKYTIESYVLDLDMIDIPKEMKKIDKNVSAGIIAKVMKLAKDEQNKDGTKKIKLPTLYAILRRGEEKLLETEEASAKNHWYNEIRKVEDVKIEIINS